VGICQQDKQEFFKPLGAVFTHARNFDSSCSLEKEVSISCIFEADGIILNFSFNKAEKSEIEVQADGFVELNKLFSCSSS